jgi:hypothetical protein
MNKDKILLYSPATTPRLEYVAGHMAGEILGLELLFTSHLPDALSADVPLINYSPEAIPGAVNIVPHGLLDETGIYRQSIDVSRVDGLPLFFQCSGKCDAGFDLFASSFYMLSRYEEYLPSIKDRHGRFPFSESLACRHDLAEEPLVELWALKLKECIERKYPRISFPVKQFSFIPTIDIDIPWAYKNRSFWRTAGGLARSFLRADLVELSARYRVLFRGEDDPYDTFDKIEKIHECRGLSPVFFLPAGTYGRFDKCIPASNPRYRRLIINISGKYQTGIHPSYNSFDDPGLLRDEIKELAVISGKIPSRSRQHFLRLGLPESYRLLIANGILEDYTMGWPEIPGLRAGTCNPFKFYDLEKEVATQLKIFPFQIMDGSLRDYLELKPDQAAEYASRIVKMVRKANGTLITLWHNETFSGSGRWKNWENVYLGIINEVVS